MVEGRERLSSADGEFCVQGEGQNVGLPVCQASASLWMELDRPQPPNIFVFKTFIVCIWVFYMDV